MNHHEWYISAANIGDGKSVCLWMQDGAVSSKIAIFQSKEAAKIFIEDFVFPVSNRVQNILDEEEQK